MGRRIVLSGRAQKQFGALYSQTRARVRKGLIRYSESSQGDAKRLRGLAGGEHLFRLRVEDYRIIFREKGKEIRVVQMLNRSQAYAWL